MDRLFEKSYKKLDRVTTRFRRHLLEEIDFTSRMIGIKGARGAGKTTLLLQYAHKELPLDRRVLYASLDDLWFTENKLVELADAFVKQGGRYLLLDEVHRYPGWSQELKNIYDDEPDLSVIFTGSSIMHLDKARADLSRRAVMYELRGLSFREYLSLTTDVLHKKLNWEDLLKDHVMIARSIVQTVRPLEHFTAYLQHGYYPYFLENINLYPQKLEETISLALSTDLPALHDLTPGSIEKIRQLLYIIAESAPFKPNISKLSERIGVTRNTLISFLHHLEDLRIINNLYHSASGIGALQKPEKIFLHHPNLQYALAYSGTNIGNIRESFFVNQVAAIKTVTYTSEGDFAVDRDMFEVGGKDKQQQQVKNFKQSFVAADGIEIGHEHKIPLWMFGLLY
ncbi:MAG: ATP-binding protein [Agriterribacter sp.]